MQFFTTTTLAILIGAALAAPVASPAEPAAVANAVFERAPAATSASGTSSSTVSCPGSNSTTFNSNGLTFQIECGLDRSGNLNMVYATNFASCIDACAAYTGCVDVSYVSNGGGACYMKSTISSSVSYGNAGIWGAKQVSGVAATSTTAVKTTSTLATSTLSTSTLKKSSSTTSTTAPATTSSPAGTATSGKRGIAYNTASYAALFSNAPEVTWGYNWGQSSGSIGHDYVPMLWGASSSFTNAWSSNAKAAIAGGSTHLLGFNEPDLSSQSNLTASAAAAAWKTNMQPFAGGSVKLVSPAVTNGGGETGLQWMKEFLGNCTSCQIDAVALHWYSSSASDLQNHVQQAWADFGKPIWITGEIRFLLLLFCWS